jgi:hypothetical protein
VVAIALLYFKINGEKSRAGEQRETRQPNPRNWRMSTGRRESTLKVLEGKIVLDLGGAHNVVTR